MTKEEFELSLESCGFSKQRFTEYNNNAFVNKSFEYDNAMLNLEVFVDRYNVRIVWWHKNGKKVSKCFYINKEVALHENARTLIEDFVALMKSTYGITL